jgi:hypothetical protein
MTDDDDNILKQLGARVREERASAAPVDDAIPAFDAAADERIVAKILAQKEARANVVALRPRARAGARWLYAAAPLAAAAAMVLFIATRGSSIAAPPAYEMSLVSVNDLRDPTSAKTNASEFTVDPDGELELVARPATPVKNARARAFLVRSGDVKPWLVPLQVSDEGAIRVTGMTRLLFPSTKEPYDVVIFVAVGESLPSEAEAEKLAAAATATDAKFRVIRAHIRFFAADSQKK